MFIRGLSDAIKAKIAFYGLDGIEPGDILLTNDAYIMGSHLNHMIFTLPIFHDGEIVGVRVLDGALASTSAARSAARQDIYSEGLQLPIVKIFKRGVQDDELTRIIRTNVRIPELRDGRLPRADRRDPHRRAALFGAAAQSTASTRSTPAIAGDLRDEPSGSRAQRVAAIPDGIYEAESFMDDDGIGDRRRSRSRCKVIVAGDQMTIDLTDVSAQVQGYFNSGARPAARPRRSRSNASRRRRSIRSTTARSAASTSCLPPGRRESARCKPAAMRMWMTIPMTVVDTIFRALAPAIPTRVIAGHHADLCSPRSTASIRATAAFRLIAAA